MRRRAWRRAQVLGWASVKREPRRSWRWVARAVGSLVAYVAAFEVTRLSGSGLVGAVCFVAFLSLVVLVTV